MSWVEPDDEERRLAAHERLLLEATEAVSKALEERGMTRRQLAGALGVRPSEITQRLSGPATSPSAPSQRCWMHWTATSIFRS
jgi:ribosome-binding protein aMBF1 (putative translation factor)